MTAWRLSALQRPLIWLLLIALVLPTLSSCANRPPSAPPAPATLALVGVVVDGQRLARRGETGLVSVWRSGQRIEGVAGLPLQPGDRVETGEAATAVVRWPSGSMVYMRPRSSGVVGSVTGFVGELFARVRGIFSVETQFVAAGARGTQFLVRSAPGASTTVTVYEGRVEVASLARAWPPVLLGEASTVLVQPGQALAPQPQAASAVEMQRTLEWVERIDKLLAAAPAGSGVGTALAIGLGAAALAVLLSGRDKSGPSGDVPKPPSDSDGVRRAQGTAGTSTSRLPQAGQPAAPVLSAPANLRPGSPDERSAPSLLCANPVPLQWDRVPGAQDYLVQLEVQGRPGQWTGVAQPVTDGLQAFTPRSLSGLHRWRVQARAAGTAGPFSAWMHMRCSPYRLN